MLRGGQMRLTKQCTRLAVIFLAVIFALPSHETWAEDKVITVSVSILPQAFFVEKIGGRYVHPLVMVPPGTSPATYEPKPRQLARLSQCAIYFAQGLPFESAWLPRFRKSNPIMRVVPCYRGVERIPVASSLSTPDRRGHHNIHLDPHIWLSPPLTIVEVRNILEALLKQDPSREEFYKGNYRRFVGEMVDLDLKIRDLFKGVGTRNSFLVYHPAWGYFAKTYGLRQLAVEREGKKPLAHDLKQFITLAKEKGFTELFIQPQISSHSARVIANSIGARLVILDPLARQWDKNLLHAAQKIRKALR